MTGKMNKETIHITILYFAKLAEDVGCREEKIQVKSGCFLNTLIETITERGDKWTMIAAPQIRCAINQNITTENPPLNNNDEVAFFPPVTGG